MNIKAALKALNPTNDEHWTADGMPRVDVVAKLVENDELKRVDITTSVPDFTRMTAKKAQEEFPGGTSGEQGPAVEVVVEAQETVVVEVASPAASLGPLEALYEERKVQEGEMYEAQAIHKEAKKDSDMASDRVNDLNRRIEVLEHADPHHSTAHIRAYLKQQNTNRLERAERLQRFIGTSGVALKEVVKELDPRGALDRAMHGRKPPRGSVRPVYIRPTAAT